jgi:hypothetical protein
VLWALDAARAAPALQTGIGGFSGKQGDTCTDSCHSGGVTPVVRFDGPREVMADAVATFRFTVQSQASRQIVAGFDVAASDGRLGVLPGQGAHLDGDEITHDAPKPNVDGEASWAFTWQAPGQTGAATLYGAGLSANGNGNRNGDDVALATFAITVTSNTLRGDANCDRRVTVADLTALLERLPSGVPGACALADADCDTAVTESDLSLVVSGLFDAAPAACGG